jgi:VIT1/CCC1 family predicted Fe2+/Mn2+ transporter
LIALIIFGYIKGRFTGTAQWNNAIQTIIVGGVAAAVAFEFARFLSKKGYN